MLFRQGLGLTLLIVILALSGCKSSGHLLCPDLATKQSHSPWFVFHSAHVKRVVGNNNSSSARHQVIDSNQLFTSANDMRVMIKMPTALAVKMQDGKEMDEVNQYLAAYKNTHVMFQRDARGALYLKAHSLNDILALGKKKNMPDESEVRFRPFTDDESRAARISMILGAVAIGLLVIFPFATPFLGIAAIVLAMRGMHSDNHQQAVTGLILGILALALPIIALIIIIAVVFATLL